VPASGFDIVKPWVALKSGNSPIERSTVKRRVHIRKPRNSIGPEEQNGSGRLISR
jgi:hypothetical protein